MDRHIPFAVQQNTQEGDKGARLQQQFLIYDADDHCNLIRHILKEFRIYEAMYKGVAASRMFFEMLHSDHRRFFLRRTVSV